MWKQPTNEDEHLQLVDHEALRSSDWLECPRRPPSADQPAKGAQCVYGKSTTRACSQQIGYIMTFGVLPRNLHARSFGLVSSGLLTSLVSSGLVQSSHLDSFCQLSRDMLPDSESGDFQRPFIAAFISLV